MVVKEALFNTVVHAEAANACVELLHGVDEVTVLVSDDGQGRAQDLQRCLAEARRSSDGYHRGLANVEQRMVLVAGRLDILDREGGGVCLQVRVPRRGPQR